MGSSLETWASCQPWIRPWEGCPSNPIEEGKAGAQALRSQGTQTVPCSQEGGRCPFPSQPLNCFLCLQVTLAATLTNARGSPLYWEITPQNMVRAGGSPPWTPVAHVPLPAARHANSHPSSLSFLPTPQEGPTVGTTAITMMRATGPPHLTTKGEGWAHQWGVTAGAQVATAPSMGTPHPLPHHPSMAPTPTALCSWSMAWINLR